MNDEAEAVRVRDIGEQGLLARLYPFCPEEMVGDDAALMAIAPNCHAVITSDMLVDGVHFSVGWASPDVYTMSAADVGWRSVAANLSDLAAMGAEPLGITVSLGLPGDLPVVWVEQLYQGMVECLQMHNAIIAGGDVCRSPVITVSITAVGTVRPEQAIRRSRAKPGDAIVVTGAHGASRAGLELLLHPDLGIRLAEGDRTVLIRAHQRPQPRLDVLPMLHQIGVFAQTPPHVAGMDSSDGLADAVLQLCRLSGTGAHLDRHLIPVPPALAQWCPADQILDWALYGGEDFELVLCLPPSQANCLVELIGAQAAIIGTMTDAAAVVLVDSQGKLPDQYLSLSHGFQHFSNTSQSGDETATQR